MFDSAHTLGIVLVVSTLLASGATGEEPNPPGETGAGSGAALPAALRANWETQQAARSLTLAIPAPRGQIVDRHGATFAQNRVCYYLAVQLPTAGDLPREDVIDFAREKVATANSVLRKSWSIDDEKLMEHYRERRWVPLRFSPPLEDWQMTRMESRCDEGLLLFPTYCRVYPHKKLAGHMIGYTGREASLPTDGLVSGEPLFPFREGRDGLEATFDEHLRGVPGELHQVFGADGEKLVEELLRRPAPGHNLVTTLDLEMQKLAERTLANYCRRGAFVVIDVQTGDILAMASRPGYDPNLFVPSIGEKTFAGLRDDPAKPMFARAYQGVYPPASTFKISTALAALEAGVIDVQTGDILAMASRPGYDPNLFVPSIGEKTFAGLRDDPSKPMFARAYQGAYPPASTFKISTALAALEAGVIDGDTRISGPGSLKIGNRWFKNWHSGHEGKIDVERAIARSCNTWFYKVGMDTGGANFSSMALRLGIGERSGIPLPGEAAGTMPTEDYMREKFGHGFSHGYLANAAIGQGNVLTTPLQVAGMMAAVGNGRFVPKLRLVSQLQDLDGNVVKRFPVESQRQLNISPENIDLVTRGMIDVVNAGHGTGKGAANGYHTVAGKTGTGQWGAPSKRQYVAWFAGFAPAEAPRYAFAALYEGRPGEYLSGGKKAAPMVSYFFRNHYRKQPGEGGSMIAGAAAKPVSKPRRSSVAVRPPARTPRPVSTKPARPILSRIFGSRKP